MLQREVRRGSDRRGHTFGILSPKHKDSLQALQGQDISARSGAWLIRLSNELIRVQTQLPLNILVSAYYKQISTLKSP